MASSTTISDPSLTPAGIPPPGVVPNLKSPPSAANVFFAEGSILLFVMFVFLGFRLYTKTRITRKATLDDLTCAIAAAGTTYYYIIVCISVTKGKIGTHIWDISVAGLTSHDFLIPAYASASWPTLIFLFTKLTFMLLYLQIFGPNRRLRWSCYTGITIMTLFYTSYWIAQVYISTPEHGQSWLEDFETSRYSKFSEVAVPLGGVGLVFDVYIFVLPIAGVTQLQMSLRRKLEVSAMFCSGFAAVIASALSLVYRVKLSSTDFTYTAFPIQITAYTELVVGVSVSCMPSTSMYFRNLKGSFSRTETTSGGRMVSSGKDSIAVRNRQRRDRGFNLSKTWQNLDESRNNLTHDTSVELGNGTSTQTFVRSGQPQDSLGDGIHFSTSFQQHAEVRDLKIMQAAHLHEGVV